MSTVLYFLVALSLHDKLPDRSASAEYAVAVLPAILLPEEREHKPPAEPATPPEQLSTNYYKTIRKLDGTVVPCIARQVLNGHPSRVGKWVIVQENVSPPAPPGDDFVNRLNSIRAQYGLRPVSYDPNAAYVASINNTHQRAKGLGHHVTGGYAQNAAVGTGDPWTAWMNSSGHRSLILDPNLQSAGGHFDGYAATLNANGHYATSAPTYYQPPMMAAAGGYRWR